MRICQRGKRLTLGLLQSRPDLVLQMQPLPAQLGHMSVVCWFDVGLCPVNGAVYLVIGIGHGREMVVGLAQRVHCGHVVREFLGKFMGCMDIGLSF